MPRKNSHRASLADPSRLAPFDGNGAHTIQVIIETPKGSRNKYSFDEELRIFKLKKVLPAGMEFPYDFGFVPSTKADDGDPVDVLVLMDEPAFPGCLLSCRIIGIIEGKQRGENGKERNDRVIAVDTENHSYSHVKHVHDLGNKFCRELEEFFVNYHDQSGKKYRLLGVKGPAEGLRRVRDGIKAARRRRK